MPLRQHGALFIDPGRCASPMIACRAAAARALPNKPLQQTAARPRDLSRLSLPGGGLPRGSVIATVRSGIADVAAAERR